MPAWRRWNLVALTASTSYSTALGRQAQQISYPLFGAVAQEDFARYHQLDDEAIPWPVIVPGFACFLGAAAFPWTRPRAVPLPAAAVVGAVGATCVLSTVPWVIPTHDRLDAEGRSLATVGSLLDADLLRTVALTIGTATLSWCTSQLLGRGSP